MLLDTSKLVSVHPYWDLNFSGEGQTRVKKPTRKNRTLIKDVIFNQPAIIVFWKDGTKTVVKQQPGDVWDPEKGLMAAHMKKMLGNDNQYNVEIKRWIPDDVRKTEVREPTTIVNTF